MDDLSRDEVAKLYRVVDDSGWKVQHLIGGDWVIAYYCSSEEGANIRREKCIDRYVEYQSKSVHERLTAILRKE